MSAHQERELRLISIREQQAQDSIKTRGDVNDLTISGHVEHTPVLRWDVDGECVCEFVLSHTTASPSGHWELQFYNVEAYGQLGEDFATTWQPGQTILITGQLDYHVCDTLAGPVPGASIIAHAIGRALGPHPHQPTATPAAYELQHTAAGVVPHLLTR